jgi:hypothetical protein
MFLIKAKLKKITNMIAKEGKLSYCWSGTYGE